MAPVHVGGHCWLLRGSAPTRPVSPAIGNICRRYKVVQCRSYSNRLSILLQSAVGSGRSTSSERLRNKLQARQPAEARSRLHLANWIRPVKVRGRELSNSAAGMSDRAVGISLLRIRVQARPGTATRANFDGDRGIDLSLQKDLRSTAARPQEPERITAFVARH